MDKRRFSMYISTEMYEAIRTIAFNKKISMAQVVKDALTTEIKRHQYQPKEEVKNG